MQGNVEFAIRAFMKSRVILTAAELDVFTKLIDVSLPAKEISVVLNLDERAATRLLDCLVALDLLEKHDGRYGTTEEGSRLSSTHERSVLPSALHTTRLWRTWSHLTEAVRKGTSPLIRNTTGLNDDERQAFIGAMDVAARELAGEVALQYSTAPFRCLLDVGGGSGAYTIAFLRRNPELRAIVFDLPSVIPMTEYNIREAGLSERVDFVPGDFYSDELPRGCDLVLLSAIIHQNGPDENRQLFRKVYRAVEEGGVLLIRDFIMDASRTKPLGGALFALNMLVGTAHGGTYTFEEVRDCLEATGFEDIQLLPSAGEKMDQLVEARKIVAS